MPQTLFVLAREVDGQGVDMPRVCDDKEDELVKLTTGGHEGSAY